MGVADHFDTADVVVKEKKDKKQNKKDQVFFSNSTKVFFDIVHSRST